MIKVLSIECAYRKAGMAYSRTLDRSVFRFRVAKPLCLRVFACAGV